MQGRVETVSDPTASPSITLDANAATVTLGRLISGWVDGVDGQILINGSGGGSRIHLRGLDAIVRTGGGGVSGQVYVLGHDDKLRIHLDGPDGAIRTGSLGVP